MRPALGYACPAGAGRPDAGLRGRSNATGTRAVGTGPDPTSVRNGTGVGCRAGESNGAEERNRTGERPRAGERNGAGTASSRTDRKQRMS